MRGPGIVVMDHGWSPVQRVTDVCNWLMAVVMRQHGPPLSTTTTTHTNNNSSSNNPSSSSLSVQCRWSSSSEDGQSTPVHRNGCLFSMDGVSTVDGSSTVAPEAVTTKLLLEPQRASSRLPQDAMEDFLLQPPSTHTMMNEDDKTTTTGSSTSSTAKRDEAWLPPGRFDLGYGREQQPMTMMMDCFDDLDL